MEIGSELSKTVATFIVQKILLDDVRDLRQHSDQLAGPNREQHISLHVLAAPRKDAGSEHVRRMPRCNVQSALQSGKPCVCVGLGVVCIHTLQVGLQYVCATAERFFAVGAVLGNMVVAQVRSSHKYRSHTYCMPCPGMC